MKNWPFFVISCDMPDKQSNLFDTIWTVLETLKERDGLEDPGINGKITLNKRIGCHGLALSDSGYEGEHRNVSSSSKKCG